MLPDTPRPPTGAGTPPPHVNRDVTGWNGHVRATAPLVAADAPETGWVDAARVCDAALDGRRDAAEARQVGLDRAFDTRLRLVAADRLLLTTLLGTLLDEALGQAAPGSRLSIETTAQVARDIVAFTVALRGPDGDGGAAPTLTPPAAVLTDLLAPLGGTLWHERTCAGARVVIEIPWGLRGTGAAASAPRVLLIYRDREAGARLAALLGREGYDPLLLDTLPARGDQALRVRPDALLVDSTLAREVQTDLVDLIRDESGLHAVPVLVTVRTCDLPLAVWLTGSPRSLCVDEPFERAGVAGGLGRLLGDQLS